MIDNQFKISAYTDFAEGWTDPVCVMCENIDEKVGIEIFVTQNACKGNCPGDMPADAGECRGFLDHVDTPPNIAFSYA